MTHSDKRYKRTVERITAETFWLYTYQKAICGFQVDSIGLDFFRVSLSALKDARLIRLIRVLEDDSKVASFWYLIRSNSQLMQKFSTETGFDLAQAKNLASRFVGIRNKTFVHIDKDGIFLPSELYKEANISHAELDEFINSLWLLMQRLHFDVFGKEVECDNYSGDDIRYLARLRDSDAAP